MFGLQSKSHWADGWSWPQLTRQDYVSCFCSPSLIFLLLLFVVCAFPLCEFHYFSRPQTKVCVIYSSKILRKRYKLSCSDCCNGYGNKFQRKYACDQHSQKKEIRRRLTAFKLEGWVQSWPVACLLAASSPVCCPLRTGATELCRNIAAAARCCRTDNNSVWRDSTI